MATVVVTVFQGADGPSWHASTGTPRGTAPRGTVLRGAVPRDVSDDTGVFGARPVHRARANKATQGGRHMNSFGTPAPARGVTLRIHSAQRNHAAKEKGAAE